LTKMKQTTTKFSATYKYWLQIGLKFGAGVPGMVVLRKSPVQYLDIVNGYIMVRVGDIIIHKGTPRLNPHGQYKRTMVPEGFTQSGIYATQ
jgi:hypothetical protein